MIACFKATGIFKAEEKGGEGGEEDEEEGKRRKRFLILKGEGGIVTIANKMFQCRYFWQCFLGLK